MGRRRALLSALFVAVIAAAAIVAPGVIHRAAFFRVHEIEVVGVRYLEESEVVERLRLAGDVSIVDPVGRVLVAAEAIPGVVAASVERRLPGTLRITILEATPVALAAQQDRLVFLDQNGRVLPFDPARAPTSLPLAEPDSASAALLARVMTTDSAWFARIERAHREGGDVLFDEGSRRVRVRASATAAILRSVTAVRTYLDRHSVAWREIDARYRDRVFVRKGSA